MKQRKKLNSNKFLERNTFTQSLEAIGDLLVFETAQKKVTAGILDNLDRIVSILRKIIENRKKNEEQFSIYFQISINQIIRIYFAGLDSKNDEISRNSTYRIIWILEDLSKKDGNREYINFLFDNLSRIMGAAIENNDISMYASSFHWYQNVFKNDFKIEYLDFFNERLFSFVQYIIMQNSLSLFQSFVSFALESIFVDYSRETLWDYCRLADNDNYRKINKKIISKRRGLDNRIDYLYANENLEIWLKEFQDLKTELEQYFNDEQAVEAEKIEEKINKTAVAKFKYNNLLEIIFALGAYSLFKEKSDYIRYIWEYKQPPDSDATWVGHDIVPNKIESLINLYYSRNSTSRIIHTWEDRHGTSSYYDRYFLLLLIRILNKSSKSFGNKETFSFLEKYNINFLHNIESSIDNLIVLSNQLISWDFIKDIFRFSKEEFNRNLSEILVPFLEELKSNANNQINKIVTEKDISKKRVEIFKKEVLSSFKDIKKLRNIFMYFNKYEFETVNKKEEESIECNSIENICEKEAFVEDWYVDYQGFGERFGRTLALNENQLLYKQIIEECEKVEEKLFLKVIKRIRNYSNYIILLNDFNLFRYSILYENFIMKNADEKNNLDFNNFSGWFKFKDNKIPIFNFNYNKSDKGILLLNKFKTGNLVQYSTFKCKKSEDDIENSINITITEFIKNPSVIENFLEENPGFFKETTSEAEKNIFFEKNVFINIYEYFKYKKAKNFKGYFLELNSNDTH